jgi:hypothetical protein
MVSKNSASKRFLQLAEETAHFYRIANISEEKGTFVHAHMKESLHHKGSRSS